MKTTSLKGKYVVVFDTIVDGHQTATDENNHPVLFNSHEEAVKDMFDDALSSLESKTPAELKEYHEGVTQKQIKEMKALLKSGTAKQMQDFLDKNPECNTNSEWVESAENFKNGYKAIYSK